MTDIVVVIAGIPLIVFFIYAISYDGFKMLKKTLSYKISNKNIN
ncbi:MAG: hypothetical protein ACJ0BU_08650 [Candidatus Puniceispirillales bacterium]|tara:strand:+ start:679 stop:810 length:132 start_codon:yes stop_codon:yes gene_type:complete